jgi:hypothetical protein
VASYPSFLKVDYLSVTGSQVSGHDGTLQIFDLGALEPGDGAVVHLRVEADHPLQPGSALVVLSVHATDKSDGTKSTIVASQKITFSVLGESGVLQLLGVPALLFVPGLVFVLVLWALWRYVFPRKEFSVAPGLGLEGKVVMWVFALLPSLAFPFLYPFITDWLGQGRDYRRAYGLDDILYVWIMAAVAAFAVWGTGVILRFVGITLFVPQEGQQPSRLVAKFAFRPWHRGLRRRSALYGKQPEQPVIQLVIVLRRRVGTKALVTPQIQYGTASLDGKESKKLQSYIPHKPLRLWFYLMRKKAEIDLSYQPQNPLTEPTFVEQSTLTDPSQENLVAESPR